MIKTFKHLRFMLVMLLATLGVNVAFGAKEVVSNFTGDFNPYTSRAIVAETPSGTTYVDKVYLSNNGSTSIIQTKAGVNTAVKFGKGVAVFYLKQATDVTFTFFQKSAGATSISVKGYSFIVDGKTSVNGVVPEAFRVYQKAAGTGKTSADWLNANGTEKCVDGTTTFYDFFTDASKIGMAISSGKIKSESRVYNLFSSVEGDYASKCFKTNSKDGTVNLSTNDDSQTLTLSLSAGYYAFLMTTSNSVGLKSIEFGADDVVSVTGVSLDKTTATIEVDANETLTATVAPANATNQTVTWSSNAESVATVANGIVTAVAPGTATITVETVDGKFTATCAVTVPTPVIKEHYAITYNPGDNGAGSIALGDKTEDVAFTLSSERFTRDGYVQIGWATTDGGAKAYAVGGEYTANAAIELFPVWGKLATDAPSLDVKGDVTIEGLEANGWYFTHAGTVSEAATEANTAAFFAAAGVAAPGDRNGIAIAKNTSAYAQYDLGEETTVTDVWATLLGGSSSAFNETIEYLDASKNVVKSYTNSLGAGNWAANDIHKTDIVDGVRYIRVKGASKWVMLTTFAVKYVSNANFYTVTFDMQDATSAAIAPQSIKEGGKATKPADPEKDGYNFGKWVVASTDADYDFDAAVTADVALKAVWDEITESWTVTYNANGGTCGTPSATYTGGDALVLPAAEFTGKLFDGWFDSEDNLIGKAGAEYTPTDNIELFAHYSYEKILRKAVFSNSFEAWIDENAKTATVYYLEGETAPTYVEGVASGECTITMSEGKLVVKDADEATVEYVLNLVAVTPATVPVAKITPTTEAEAEVAWIKNNYGWASDKGWKFQKTGDDADWSRRSNGNNHVYLFVGACKNVNLTWKVNRAIKVYRNGVEVTATTADGVLTIPGDIHNASMIKIASNQNSGDGGFSAVEVIAHVVSTDATLKTLAYGETPITLVAEQFTYSVELPWNTTAVPALAAETNDANATMVITNATEIPGTATVVVTAEDGTTTKTYTVNYTVADHYVAEVEGTGYTTLAAAFAAAEEGQIVKLLEDIEGAVEYTNAANITLDLNNYELTSAAATATLKNNGGTLTITDNSDAKGGKITSTNAAADAGIAVWARTGSIVINGGTFENNNKYEATVYVGTSTTTAVLTINDGTFKNNSTEAYAYNAALKALTVNMYNALTYPAVVINGGVFYGNDPWQDDNVKTVNGIFTAAGKTTESTATGVYGIIDASDDATLKSLKANGVAIEDFDAATLVYEVEYPYGSSEIPQIAAEANEEHASVTVNQAATLLDKATVVVLSQDRRATTTYEITFVEGEQPKYTKLFDYTWTATSASFTPNADKDLTAYGSLTAGESIVAHSAASVFAATSNNSVYMLNYQKNDNYVEIELAGTNVFKAGDRIVVIGRAGGDDRGFIIEPTSVTAEVDGSTTGLATDKHDQALHTNFTAVVTAAWLENGVTNKVRIFRQKDKTMALEAIQVLRPTIADEYDALDAVTLNGANVDITAIIPDVALELPAVYYDQPEVKYTAKHVVEYLDSELANLETLLAEETATVTSNGDKFEATFTVGENNYIITTGRSLTPAIAEIEGRGQYFTLQEAVAAAENGDEIIMLADVELDAYVTIPADKNITVDLNGKTIEAVVAPGLVFFNKGGLTITDKSAEKNGWLKGTFGVQVHSNSTTTIEAGNIESVEGAIITGTATGATINVKGGYLHASDNAVIAGNGSNRAGDANHINISGGMLEGDIVTAGYVACGIYAPWKDVVTVTGGEIKANGGCGILVRAGNVTVSGGQITTTGTVTGKVGDSRVIVPCAAIVYDSEAGYPAMDAESVLEVTGGTFESEAAALVNVGSDVRIEVAGGDFSSEVPAEYCAVGYEPAFDSETGKYGVKVQENILDIEGDMTFNFVGAVDAQVDGVNDGTYKVLASYDGVKDQANGLYVAADFNKITTGNLQGKGLKFHTTVPGFFTIEFSNTGSSTRPNRELYINGVATGAKSKNTTHVTYTQFVEAGDVVLTAFEETATWNMLNFYKVTFVTELADDKFESVRTLSSSNIGTICLEKGVAAFKGATFYEIAYVEMQGGQPYKVFFDQVEKLEAGRAYIFEPEEDAAEIMVAYDGLTAATPVAAADNNGLQGTFTGIEAAAENVLNGNYIINSNKIRKCAENCYLNDHRAYIVMSNVLGYEGEPAPAPAAGRKRISLGGASAENATDLLEVLGAEGVQKVLIDGAIYIIREGQMYNVNGVLVK